LFAQIWEAMSCMISSSNVPVMGLKVMRAG
jgi:hypothetical protein